MNMCAAWAMACWTNALNQGYVRWDSGQIHCSWVWSNKDFMAQIQGLATSCPMLLIQCLFPHSTCRYNEWPRTDQYIYKILGINGPRGGPLPRDWSHKCHSLLSLGLISISKLSMLSVWYLTKYISGRIQWTGLIDDVYWSGLGLVYDGQRHGLGTDRMYIQLELGSAPMGLTGHKKKLLSSALSIFFYSKLIYEIILQCLLICVYQ